MVVSCPARAERALRAGTMSCPRCTGQLRPYGHGRTRTVRGLGAAMLTVTPRRARCADCAGTQILLPTELTTRRADSTEVIGNAWRPRRTERGSHHRQAAAATGVHRACLAAPGPGLPCRVVLPAGRGAGGQVRPGAARAPGTAQDR